MTAWGGYGGGGGGGGAVISGWSWHWPRSDDDYTEQRIPGRRSPGAAALSTYRPRDRWHSNCCRDSSLRRRPSTEFDFGSDESGYRPEITDTLLTDAAAAAPGGRITKWKENEWTMIKKARLRVNGATAPPPHLTSSRRRKVLRARVWYVVVTVSRRQVLGLYASVGPGCMRQFKEPSCGLNAANGYHSSILTTPSPVDSRLVDCLHCVVSTDCRVSSLSSVGWSCSDDCGERVDVAYRFAGLRLSLRLKRDCKTELSTVMDETGTWSNNFCCGVPLCRALWRTLGANTRTLAVATVDVVCVRYNRLRLVGYNRLATKASSVALSLK